MQSDVLATFATIGNLVTIASSRWELEDVANRPFDFILRQREDGRRVAIIVRRIAPAATQLHRLAARRELSTDISALWIVVARESATAEMPVDSAVKIISLSVLPKLLGVAEVGDASAPLCRLICSFRRSQRILPNIDRDQLGRMRSHCPAG